MIMLGLFSAFLRRGSYCVLLGANFSFTHSFDSVFSQPSVFQLQIFRYLFSPFFFYLTSFDLQY